MNLPYHLDYEIRSRFAQHDAKGDVHVWHDDSIVIYNDKYGSATWNGFRFPFGMRDGDLYWIIELPAGPFFWAKNWVHFGETVNKITTGHVEDSYFREYPVLSNIDPCVKKAGMMVCMVFAELTYEHPAIPF